MRASTVDQSDGLIRVLSEISEALSRNNLYLEATAKLPTLSDESNYDTSGLITNLIVAPKTSNYFLVRQVAYSLPVGASGVITLGGIRLPVPAGTNVFNWYQILSPNATRQLTTSVTGTLSLALMGDILSRRLNYR